MKQILWDLEYRERQALSMCDRGLWANGRTEQEIIDDLAEDNDLTVIEAGNLSIAKQLESLTQKGQIEKLAGERYRSAEVL